MNIAIVGTGYVGLVSGTCLADMGNDVTCIDVDTVKIKRLQAGDIPIYEPDLEHLVKRNVKEGRLHFTTSLKGGVADVDVIFLALPTPPSEDGSADLSYILGVADDLGPLLKKYAVVVDKSTVPVGTAERVKERIAKNAKVEFDVASNPEFLREGKAISDFMHPDRVVIGTSSLKAQKILKELYEPFVRQGNPIFCMNERSAEMAKYAANAFLATKISFMNEIANLCSLVGADVDAIRLSIGADERIGKGSLFPGPGFGGSCFPKDVKALYSTAHEHNYDFLLLEAVSDVNERQKRLLFNKANNYFNGTFVGKTIALWGLAFKANTDDVREAASLTIIESLTLAGANVVAYDPEANGNVKKYFANNKKLDFTDDAYKALKSADALIIVTEWDEFRTPSFDKMAKAMKSPVIFDGRNLYEPLAMKGKGFYYESIGREVVNA